MNSDPLESLNSGRTYLTSAGRQVTPVSPSSSRTIFAAATDGVEI